MHNHKNTFKPLILVLSLLFCSTFVYASNAKNTIQSPLDFTPEEACSFNGINYFKAVKFVKKLQAAIKMDDKNAVANMVSYPMKINKLNNKKVLVHFFIRGKQEFLQQYENILTPKNKKYILDNDPKDIFCNYQGAMVGAGTVWFEDDSINVINVF